MYGEATSSHQGFRVQGFGFRALGLGFKVKYKRSLVEKTTHIPLVRADAASGTC